MQAEQPSSLSGISRVLIISQEWKHLFRRLWRGPDASGYCPPGTSCMRGSSAILPAALGMCRVLGLGKAQTPNHVTCRQDTAAAPSPPALLGAGHLRGEPRPIPALLCVPHTPRSVLRPQKPCCNNPAQLMRTR